MLQRIRQFQASDSLKYKRRLDGIGRFLRCGPQRGIKPERDPHRFRHAIEVGGVSPGILIVMAPVGIAPFVVPLETIVVFEFDSAQAARDFLALATAQRLIIRRRIPPAPKTELLRLSVLFQKVTDLTPIALAGAPGRVVVCREVKIISRHVFQRAVHAQEVEVFGKGTRAVKVRAEQSHRHARALKNIGA